MSQVIEVFWEFCELCVFFDPEFWLYLAVAILVCLAFFAILLTLLCLPKWVQRVVGVTVLLVGGWMLVGTCRLALVNDPRLVGSMAAAGVIFGMILVIFGGTFALFPVSPERIRGQVPDNG